jgi:hypothetical protein
LTVVTHIPPAVWAAMDPDMLVTVLDVLRVQAESRRG